MSDSFIHTLSVRANVSIEALQASDRCQRILRHYLAQALRFPHREGLYLDRAMSDLARNNRHRPNPNQRTEIQL